MKFLHAARAALLLAAVAIAGCGERAEDARAGHDTAVLGGYGDAHKPEAGALPPPPNAPRGTAVVKASDDTALALWIRDGRVVTATHSASGWSAPQPLEEIYGEASEAQLASNGQGSAMAVWRHTVGAIQSLRYSRFDSSGWSVPDVMPGALPQPASARVEPPRLAMDSSGQVVARWPSGFDAREMQTARYVPGQGWSRAASEPVAAGPGAPSVQ